MQLGYSTTRNLNKTFHENHNKLFRTFKIIPASSFIWSTSCLLLHLLIKFSVFLIFCVQAFYGSVIFENPIKHVLHCYGSFHVKFFSYMGQIGTHTQENLSFIMYMGEYSIPWNVTLGLITSIHTVFFLFFPLFEVVQLLW